MRNMHAHAPILDVVATTGIRTKGITDSKVDKRPVSHASVHDEEASRPGGDGAEA